MATTKKARAIKTYENGTKRFATLVNGKGLDNFEKIFPLLPPEYNWLCMNMDGQVWGYIDKPVEAKYHCYFVGVNNERGIWVGENFDCGFGHWQNSVVHRDNHQAVLAEKTKAISGTVSERATKPVPAEVPAEVQEIIIDQRAAISDLFFMIGTSQPDEELLLESANQFVELMSSLGHGGIAPESIVADFKNRV